jgi:hypothetical protein
VTQGLLVPDPGWGPRAGRPVCQAGCGNSSTHELKKADAWTIDVDVILSKLDESIKVLIVNSPSNPTGAMITAADDWKRIMGPLRATKVSSRHLLRRGLPRVLLQSAPNASALPHDPTSGEPADRQQLLQGLCHHGLALGFAVGHPWLIRQMDVYNESRVGVLSLRSPSGPSASISMTPRTT